jgi:hypothetical protein
MGRYIAIVVPLSAECNPSGYKLGPPDPIWGLKFK